jgi:uncharacterized protein YxeA
MILIVFLMIVLVIAGAAQYHKERHKDKEIFNKYLENRRGIKFTRRNNKTEHSNKYKRHFG